MRKFIIAVFCAVLIGGMPSFAKKDSSQKKAKKTTSDKTALKPRQSHTLEELDLDGDGRLSRAEYLSRPKKGSMSDEKHLKETAERFTKRDVNEDGFVSREEYALILSGKNANIEEYRAKHAQQTSATVASSPEAVQAEISRLVAEALAKEKKRRQEAKMKEDIARLGILIYDTRVKTTKTTVLGRLVEKKANNDLSLEILPGVLASVLAADIVSVEPVSLADSCNREALKKLGM